MEVRPDAIKLARSVMEHDGGQMTASEYLENSLSDAPDDDEIQSVIEDYPGLTEAEARSFSVFMRCADLEDGWLKRGLARRLILDAPEDLASFMSVAARISFIWESDPDNEYMRVFDILHAYAARDYKCADALLKRQAYPLKSGHPDTVLLYNAVHAVAFSNNQQLEAIVERMKSRKKVTKWIQGAFEVFAGIHEQAPSLVANGLSTVLRAKSLHAGMMSLRKYICLEAHGIYRLVESCGNSLVEEVDVMVGLPWDRDFHVWTQSNSDFSVDFCSLGLPRDIRDGLSSLSTPPFMRKLINAM